MPDLKSELERLLEQKPDDEVQNEIITTSETKRSGFQQVWELVKAMPGVGSPQLLEFIPREQRSGLATRLSQLRDAGKLRREGTYGAYRWYAVGDTYPKRKTGPKSKRKAKGRPVKLSRKMQEFKDKIGVKYKLEPVPLKQPDWQEYVDKLRLSEAKDLYAYLNGIFGG